MTKTNLLNKKCALVTGAARGNGAAIARGLCDHGAKVILADLDERALEAQLKMMRNEGRHCAAVVLDVSDPDACRLAAARVSNDHGDLDILVNNAGIRPRHSFDAADRDDHWNCAIRVNLEGIRNTTLAWLDGLRRRRGTVINVTSIAAFNASPGSIGYSTSKAGAEMLSKALACELAADGIRVNAVAPGVIETDMTITSRNEPARRDRLLSRIPMGRFGKPEDLVGASVFLASDLAAYVTGCTIVVDGGYLAN